VRDPPAEAPMAATLHGSETPRKSAPDFQLESHSGERVRLSEFRGKRRVVLFFMRAYT